MLWWVLFPVRCACLVLFGFGYGVFAGWLFGICLVVLAKGGVCGVCVSVIF